MDKFTFITLQVKNLGYMVTGQVAGGDARVYAFSTLVEVRDFILERLAAPSEEIPPE